VSDQFHKPTLFSGSKFDALEGGDDPARVMRVAHETARALLSRARNAGDPEVVDRLVHYLVRLLIHQDPAGVSLLFQRGTEVLPTIDALVAGAPIPAGPDEVTDLADRILRGVFEGDFALALDRAAAFCRVAAAGATSIADDQDAASPHRATELTTRALRLTTTADELTACARLARDGALE
jgi:hypothetical protein